MAANGINYTSTRGADASHGGITIETTADSPKGSNAHDDDADLGPYGGERNDLSNEPSTFAKHLIDMAEKGGDNPHASIHLPKNSKRRQNCWHRIEKGRRRIGEPCARASEQSMQDATVTVG